MRLDIHVHHHLVGGEGVAKIVAFIKQGFTTMADKLDTVLERVAAQTAVIDGITVILDTWTDDRATLRAQIVELQAALGEAGNDTEQVDALLSAFDANDAKLAAVRDKLAPAVVENTPSA